jgi:hypothetical protein
MTYNISVTTIISGTERDDREGNPLNKQQGISIEVPKNDTPSEDIDSPDSEVTWQRRVMSDKFTWQTLVNSVFGLEAVWGTEPDGVIFLVKQGFEAQQLIPQIQSE